MYFTASCSVSAPDVPLRTGRHEMAATIQKKRALQNIAILLSLQREIPIWKIVYISVLLYRINNGAGQIILLFS
jgi:hypothetical protein